MVRNRVTRAIACAALVAIGAGCGGGYYREADARAPSPSLAPSPMAPPMQSGAAAKSEDAEMLAGPFTAPGPQRTESPHSAAMLVYTASFGMAVYQVTPAMDAVEHVATDVGGYLSARQDNTIAIRVPRERFDEVVARIEAIGDVTHRDIRAEDVTDQFVDLDGRLKNALAIRARFTELLERASVQEALAIEKELGRISEEIERLQGKLKLLRSRIAFSTVSVTFAPLAAQAVHDTSLLAPFPWLQGLGLQSLLNVGGTP
jgi:hypothetical protein